MFSTEPVSQYSEALAVIMSYSVKPYPKGYTVFVISDEYTYWPQAYYMILVALYI